MVSTHIFHVGLENDMIKWLRCWLAQSILFDSPLDKLKVEIISTLFWIHASLFWISGLALQLAASWVCVTLGLNKISTTHVWRKRKQLQERSRPAIQVFTCLTKVVTRETHQQLWSRKKRQLQDRKRLLRMQAAKILRKLFMNIFTWRYLKNSRLLLWLFRCLGQEEEASARKKQVGFGNAHVIMLVFACESHVHVSACPRVSTHDSTYSNQSLQSWISLWGGRSSCQEETGAQGNDACQINRFRKRFPFLL